MKFIIQNRLDITINKFGQLIFNDSTIDIAKLIKQFVRDNKNNSDDIGHLAAEMGAVASYLYDRSYDKPKNDHKKMIQSEAFKIIQGHG